MRNNIKRIEIDDLTIRMYQKEDAILLKKAIDSSLEHLKTFMDWAYKEPLPLETKIEKIEKWQKEFKENKNYTFGIFKGNKVVGNCGLYKRTEGSVLEIGYWIRANEIKKGIATKATLALIKLAFEHINIERIEIHMYSDNKASKKVPEKLFFTKMQDYTFEKKDDSSWYVLKRKDYFQNSYDSFYSNISFK